MYCYLLLVRVQYTFFLNKKICAFILNNNNNHICSSILLSLGNIVWTQVEMTCRSCLVSLVSFDPIFVLLLTIEITKLCTILSQKLVIIYLGLVYTCLQINDHVKEKIVSSIL